MIDCDCGSTIYARVGETLRSFHNFGGDKSSQGRDLAHALSMLED